MKANKYDEAVMELIRFGHVTQEQLREMAAAVRFVSDQTGEVDAIDDVILGKRIKCPECWAQYRPTNACWRCGDRRDKAMVASLGG